MSAEAFLRLMTEGDIYAAHQALEYDYSEGYVLTGTDGSVGTVIVGVTGSTLVTLTVRQCEIPDEGCALAGGDHHPSILVTAYTSPETARRALDRAIDEAREQINMVADMARMFGQPAPTMAPL